MKARMQGEREGVAERTHFATLLQIVFVPSLVRDDTFTFVARYGRFQTPSSLHHHPHFLDDYEQYQKQDWPRGNAVSMTYELAATRPIRRPQPYSIIGLYLNFWL